MPPRLISDKMLDLFPMVRTGGRHLSSAIHRIMRSLYPDRFTDTPIDQVRANLGNALESAIVRALAELYPDRYVRPGELFYDGVYGTPDLWDLEENAVVEIKCTWASSRRAIDIEDAWFIRYWWQGKGYAKMSRMRKVILIIVFIVGDWRDGPPVGYAWEDTFTDDELDENWAMLKSNLEEEPGQGGGKNKPKRKS